MERATLRTFLYLALIACLIGLWGSLARDGAAAWPSGLGLLMAASALYVGTNAPCPPRGREPWERADSFRIGPPPDVPIDPARRLPNAGTRR